jgi:DNA-binding MarR family transcriptional regulator
MAVARTEQATEKLRAWRAFLRAHAAVTRELNADLVARDGLTINDYEVLLLLSRADGRKMRRVDLSARVLLTPSGITRLLDGLEASGLVERAECKSDRRVTYAQLTDAGLAKLKQAAHGHLTRIDELFLDRYTEDEREALASLLERLPAVDGVDDCAPSDDA